MKNNDHIKIRITGNQFAIVLCIIALGGFIPITSIGQEMGTSIWLTHVFSAIAAVAFTFVYMLLGKLYTNRNMSDINKLAFGKIAGNAVTLLLSVFFLAVCIFFMFSLIHYWISLNMSQTPVIVYALLIALLCFFAGCLGFEAIARSCTIILFVMVATVVINASFLVPKMEAVRLLPLWQFDHEMMLKNLMIFFPFFAVIPCFGFIFADAVDISERKNHRSFLKAAIISSCFYISVSLFNVMVLGDSISIFTYPTIQALSMIELSSTFARIELFGILGLLSVSTMFLILAYYGVAKNIAIVFNARSHRLPLAVILLISVIGIYFIFKQNVPILSEAVIGSGIKCCFLIMEIIAVIIVRGLYLRHKKVLE